MERIALATFSSVSGIGSGMGSTGRPGERLGLGDFGDFMLSTPDFSLVEIMLMN